MKMATVLAIWTLALAAAHGDERHLREADAVSLLKLPAVQKELHLTVAQKGKIEELLTLSEEERAEIMSRVIGEGEGEGEEADPKVRDGYRRDAIKGILSAGQFTRYFQLVLQFLGPSVISEKQVATKLGITSSQKAKIRAAIGKQRQEPPKQTMAEMDKKRDLTDKAILAVLTANQKSKWKAMQGKPFKFERPAAPRKLIRATPAILPVARLRVRKTPRTDSSHRIFAGLRLLCLQICRGSATVAISGTALFV